MPLTPVDFVAKWRGNTTKERSAAQEHFIDLCRLLGHPTPNEVKDGSLVFEAGLGKVSGRQGYADVYKRGHFAWEYKGPKGDLDKAYQQLLQYREALENPPLLIVCDLETIQIHTNFTNTVKQVTTITLDDLLTPAGLETLRRVFFEPERFRAAQTTEEATREVAVEFAKLAEQLRRYGEPPEKVAHFLIRLLFCLFAEDVGLLPNGLFSRLITATRHRAPAFAAQLRQLFATMATGGFFGIDELPHFNGSLFDDDSVIELDSDSLDILARVSGKDWSSIEPSILGTLFERSLDPAKRAQLGAHYTSREDILLIVEPVLMAPLRREWATVQATAIELTTKRDAAEGGQRTRLTNEITALLRAFADKLGAVKVLDPACGSGNFLYVALKALLDLEKEVLTLAGAIGSGSFFPQVGPEQLLGIEVNEYAHELARITVWIGYIQWLRENGYGRPTQPILKPLDTIRRMDAVLAFDDAGQPVEPEWPDATVIIGNPPFLGDKRMRSELGGDYVEALRSLYAGRVPGGADFVTYWFERARAMIEAGAVQRAGLIATNSLRYGANRTVLERIKASGDVFMAWSDHNWLQDGAAVRVSIAGFDNGNEKERQLDGRFVTTINPDLTSEANLATAQPLSENADLCFLGMLKSGPFELTPDQAVRMLTAKGNPNNRPNSDVVRPRVNGQDIVRRSKGGFIINFVEMSEQDASLYEQPFEYVKRVVKPVRDISNDKQKRVKWWLHARTGGALRRALVGKFRYIITPEVAKYRIFVWMSSDVVPDHTCHVIARDDDYFFGVLHSRFHEVWSLRIGNYMGVGNDPRYNSSRTFETFPFPWPPGSEPSDDPRVAAIAAAAKRLVELRDNWLNPADASEAELKKRTLTNLYNARPTWLANAHAALDKAVAAAYGWPSELSDEEILARLLELNKERAAGG